MNATVAILHPSHETAMPCPNPSEAIPCSPA
jgi:hypothetical protein